MKSKISYSGNLFNDILRISGTKRSDFLNAEFDDEPDFDTIEFAERLQKQKTLVVHDSDCDGISSLCVFDEYAKRMGLKYEHQFVPRSQRNIGWYISGELRNVSDTNIVFLDCGSGLDEESYRKLEKSGNSICVVDHHQIDEDKIAKDMYIINPQRGNKYHYLSGSGVTYYVLKQLFGENLDALQFASIGTVADMVPLIGLNRNLVRNGLDNINSTLVNTNLYILIKSLSIRNSPLTENDIAFYIAPVINAASRFGKTELAISILVDGKEKAAKELVEINNERKELINKAIEEVPMQNLPHCVISETDDSQFSNVLGLIATRLMHKYNKPFASIMKYKDTASISFRIPQEGFDLTPFFSEMKDIFEGGNHAAAGGGTCKIGDLKTIKERFIQYCEQNFEVRPETHADIYVPERYISDIIKELPEHSPFGMGFKNPSFMSDVLLKNIKQISERFTIGKFVWNDEVGNQQEIDLISYRPIENTGFVQVAYQIFYDKGVGKAQVVETSSYE